MPKPALGKVAVGDRLLIVERRYAHRNEAPIEAEVTKVGRVWIELTPVAGGRERRMRLDTQTDGSGFGYPSRFVTREQWEFEERADAAHEYLRQARLLPSSGPWSNDEARLLALAEFVRAYDEQHPA